jgi:hypothetical protein
MKVQVLITDSGPDEVVTLQRDNIETVEDMLFFFHRVMEAAGYPYIDGVGAITKKQHYERKEWWSTL